MSYRATTDLPNMRGAVFFDGPDSSQKTSRFWLLLVLASVIAAAGVVGDSTATVIGAMIVAPLMTPILGTMLAVILGDRRNLIRCVALVVSGALVAVAVGYVLGILVVNPVVAATNAQVASRVSPRLIDLLAALATGAVGSIALVRNDISDTLPGVAIAISLVPPLSVVGLTFEAGAYSQAAGALLLFTTNVAAILTAGVAVMATYGVHRMKPQVHSSEERAVNRRNALVIIIVSVFLVSIPLTETSFTVARETRREASVETAAKTWGRAVGWDVVNVTTDQGKVVVNLEGPLPIPPTNTLRADVIAQGVNPTDVRIELTPRRTVTFSN